MSMNTHTHTQCMTMHTTTFPKPIAQNQWPREKTIEVHGNLLQDCLAACFGLHGSRIQCQWQINQQQKDQPIVVTKEEVEEQRLVDQLLRDDDEQMTFATWWKSVDKDDIVKVQFPHDHHGHAGKPSNHSK